MSDPNASQSRSIDGNRQSRQISLVVHPERKRLKRLILDRRAQLSELLAVRFELCYEALPAAQYQYSQLFGAIEREIQVQSLKMAERRRLAELLAIKLQRGQPIDQETLDLTMSVVRNEFGEVRRRLDRGVKFDNSAESFVRTSQESRESHQSERSSLQRLFRQLAKQLHPDRSGRDDPMYERYWELTLAAYARGDVASLRSIANSLCAGNGGSELNTPGGLEAYLNQLDEAIRREKQRISELTSTEPLSLGNQMEDEEWVREKRERLQNNLREINASVQRYQDMLEPILQETIEPELKEVVMSWSDYIDEMYLSGRH